MRRSAHFPRWRELASAGFLFVASSCGLAAGACAETIPQDADRHAVRPDAGRRVVAIGDVHGALDSLRTILREAGLLDAEDRWIGGDTILVQTGDFLDRGAAAIEVAYLLMDLQEQAPASGGRVEVLLGNHEVLNLIGDLRDVTEDILGVMIDESSEKRLADSCDRYVDYYRELARRQRLKPPKKRVLLTRCYEEQQLGLVEYLEEIGADGGIGSWIRGLPAVAQLGGVVLLHGGISSAFAGRGLAEINREVRREIDSFDEVRRYLIEQGFILPTSSFPVIITMARQLSRAVAKAAASDYDLPPGFEHMLDIESWLLIREDGPLWFRGYARWTEEEGATQLPAILEALGAEQIVVAHTPQASKSITPRFDSRVFLIDTGMLKSFYRGRPSALEIENGSFTAIYPEQKQVLREPRSPRSPTEQPAGR